MSARAAGSGQRAFTLRQRGRHYRMVLAKLTRLGMQVEVRMVVQDATEETAFRIEKERIASWRESGVELANGTSGGEGASGLKWSRESRKKLSVAAKKRMTKEAREAISAKLKGHRLSGQSLENYKAAMALRVGKKRKPHSEETRRKLSATARLRKPPSDATRAKMRSARMGWTWSPEVRAKMSASAHLRYGSVPK
jgi:hypothetical protein